MSAAAAVAQTPSSKSRLLYRASDTTAVHKATLSDTVAEENIAAEPIAKAGPLSGSVFAQELSPTDVGNLQQSSSETDTAAIIASRTYSSPPTDLSRSGDNKSENAATTAFIAQMFLQIPSTTRALSEARLPEPEPIEELPANLGSANGPLPAEPESAAPILLNGGQPLDPDTASEAVEAYEDTIPVPTLIPPLHTHNDTPAPAASMLTGCELTILSELGEVGSYKASGYPLYLHWTSSVSNSSWESLGCLQSLTELAINGIMPQLPDNWAANGSFPMLRVLSFSSNPNSAGAPRAEINGVLPSSWGQPFAFPSLRYLDLANSSLSGPLPPAWGSQGGFQNLTQLQLYETNISGEQPSMQCSTATHEAG